MPTGGFEAVEGNEDRVGAGAVVRT